MRLRRLPLAAWAGLLSGGAVLAVCATAGAVLLAAGRLDALAAQALLAGAGVGLLLAGAAVAAADRAGRGVRRLRDDAVRRLHEPTGPVEGVSRPLLAAASSELAELSAVLDALHRRVRLSDELGQRHRRDAQTASAGVFELLSGLVAAEEGARGQLAAELHDTVAQSLMIARGLLLGGEPDLVKVSDYVEDAEEQVRAVMARTRPPALRDGDLGSAVSALQADVRQRYGLEVEVRWPAVPHPLPSASAVTVYRFFQEALHNVVKHADVDDAVVALDVVDGVLVATVRDEGPGFDPSAVRPDRGRHVGLGLLRERARLAGGRLEVESRAGDGTTLTLRLPLPSVTVPAQRSPEVSVAAGR